jgi:hypothetical protein
MVGSDKKLKLPVSRAIMRKNNWYSSEYSVPEHSVKHILYVYSFQLMMHLSGYNLLINQKASAHWKDNASWSSEVYPKNSRLD